MIGRPKIAVAVAGLIAAGWLSVREMQSACVPPKADAHGHGEGGEQHASEGFSTRVCEEGFFAAVKEQIGLGAPAMAVKAEKIEKPDDHKSGDPGHGDHGDHSAKKPPAKKMDEHGHAEGEAAHGAEGGEGFVKLTAAQIAANGIDMAPVASGVLVKEIAVPGRIAANPNAQARVVAKLPGTVAKVMKSVGDTVAEGDVLALLESREMADAKGEFLAAVRTQELTASTFEREERLWKQKVTAEQEYLNAKNANQEALIKVDLAHQRLHTTGLTEAEIKALPKARDKSTYRFYELKAPIAGRVVARDLVMGQIVGTDREVFSLADLAQVSVEMAVSPNDLPFAREGQDVRITSGSKSAIAKVTVVSPSIDPETRTAKVIAELANASGEWQLGDFVDARLMSGQQEVALLVPRDALQTIKGSTVVFVSEGAGFRMRPVTTGREDTQNVELLSGLEFGETVATKNTFTLKAELGKAEAEHEH